ncbi:hypothetical protein P8C59_003598 [Phyllachora maydis]|uniref:Uncharacterized protein n=1 Tax=Phyllachora maydis TaxID=1825666 RepID=A0AAD9MCK7_9PEZI|nr:hypothetical protein P8C59_003598 [Phyllachora maydis]
MPRLPGYIDLFLCTKNQTPCRRRSPPPSPLPTVASAPGVVLALKTSLLLLHAAWLAGSGVLAAALDDGLGTTPRAGALGRRKQHESTDECYDTTHTDLEAFDQADLARFISELFATPEDTIFVKAGSQRSKDGDKCRICINNYSSKDTSVRLWEMAWAAGYAVNKINGNGCCPDTDSLCRGGLLTGHGTNNAEVRIGVQSAGSKCVPMATMEAHL